MMQKTLYNVWRTTSELWDSVSKKRMVIQELRLTLKLYLVLNEQVMSLVTTCSCLVTNIEFLHGSIILMAREKFESFRRCGKTSVYDNIFFRE